MINKFEQSVGLEDCVVRTDVELKRMKRDWSRAERRQMGRFLPFVPRPVVVLGTEGPR